MKNIENELITVDLEFDDELDSLISGHSGIIYNFQINAPEGTGIFFHDSGIPMWIDLSTNIEAYRRTGQGGEEIVHCDDHEEEWIDLTNQRVELKWINNWTLAGTYESIAETNDSHSTNASYFLVHDIKLKFYIYYYDYETSNNREYLDGYSMGDISTVENTKFDNEIKEEIELYNGFETPDTPDTPDTPSYSPLTLGIGITMISVLVISLILNFIFGRKIYKKKKRIK